LWGLTLSLSRVMLKWKPLRTQTTEARKIIHTITWRPSSSVQYRDWWKM